MKSSKTAGFQVSPCAHHCAVGPLDDPELALSLAGGALMGIGVLIRSQPERDDGATADRVTEDVLRLFGLAAEQAREICRRPLPDLQWPSASNFTASA